MRASCLSPCRSSGCSAALAERVEDPTLISLEEPVLQKEDFKAIVESNIAVQGTLRECAYFRAEAGNAVCFIVSMTVDVDTVLHGEVDAASIRIVSGSCYTALHRHGDPGGAGVRRE